MNQIIDPNSQFGGFANRDEVTREEIEAQAQALLAQLTLDEKLGMMDADTPFIFGMRDARKAALAGLDMEMPFQMHYHKRLKGLVESGEVPQGRIDDAVLRLLRQQLRLLKAGDYDSSQVGHAESRALAREAAHKSIVLLKNSGDLLPLADFQTIAVIGHLADTPNTGDDGSSNTRPEYVVTPLAGLKAALAGRAQVRYDDGRDFEQAKAIAKAVDVVLLVVGYNHKDEGEFLDPLTIMELARMFPAPTAVEEQAAQGFVQALDAQSQDAFLSGGDRVSLTLHPHDETLIHEIAAVNPKTVVAIMGGSAVIMESWRANVPAILMLWYPGMEGGHALADILLGRINPSGKLPFVIPQRAEDLPFFDREATAIEYDLWHGYRQLQRDGVTPAFPFGYGLSYTEYRYDNLRLRSAQLSPADKLHISLDVTNSGTQAGEEIVQLYVSALDSTVPRAPKELKAFRRVAIQPGETLTVEFAVPVSRLAYYDESQSKFVVEALEYELFAGAHSEDPHALKARFAIKAV